VAVTLKRKGGPRPDPDSMTLIEHLAELRQRVIVSVLGFGAAAVIAFVFYNQILRILQRPYCIAVGGHHCKFLITGVVDPLTLRVDVAVFGGFILALPILLWEFWAFVTPGLRDSERRYAVPFLSASVSLFLLGSAVAYFVLPDAIRFFAYIGGPSLNLEFTAPKYLRFILILMAAFGVSFEFPVILVALELVGVLSTAQLARWRRKAILIIFLLVAIFIPTGDPFSMLAMAIPLCLFYEGAIQVGRLLGK
jgi:sec-independent protein translocase protein TatC